MLKPRLTSPWTFRGLALLTLLGAVIWMFLTATPPEVLYAARAPAPQAGFPAPDLELPTRDGDMARLSALLGTPVVLNFWASWCPPCRLEMPALQRVAQAYAGRVVVVGVNAAAEDKREQAEAFLREREITFPIWWDETGEAMTRYRIMALPTTFFIDARGTICEVVVGGPMAEALLRTRIQNLEAGCSPSFNSAP